MARRGGRKSEKKWQRQMKESLARIQAREERGKGKGKTRRPKSAVPKNVLKSDGRYWVPRVSAENLAKMKKGEHVQAGEYSYMVDSRASSPNLIRFEVIFGRNNPLIEEKTMGYFEIDVTNKIIRWADRGNLNA